VLPTAVRNAIIAVTLLIVLVPVGYILMASMMPDVDVARGQLFPTSIDLGNYARIWRTVALGQGLLNSLIVCTSSAAICALMSLFTAWFLVRYAFRGRTLVLRMLMALQSVPGTLLLLPVFVLFTSAQALLGVTVVGSLWGLTLTYLTFGLPFSTWVMITYLRGLPIEFEEAARIDGCTTVGLLRRVVIPLSWPGIVVSGIFAFLLGWNDVLFASVLTKPSTQTTAVVLQVFGAAQDGGTLPLYGQLMASAIVCAAPVVLLYLLCQRFLIGGMTAGGLK
jgi:multiple sugar transport system permease protein